MSVWSATGARNRWRSFASSSSGAFAQTLLLRIALICANVATGIIAARKLAPTGRGELAAIVLWPGILCGLLTLGVPLAVNFNLRRHPERQGELLSAGVVLGAILGVVATIVGALFIPHWLGRYGHDVIRFAQWMMLLAPVTMITWVLQAALESRSDFTSSSVSKSMPQFGTLTILAVLVLSSQLTPFSAALAYTVPYVIAPVALAWKLRAVFSRRLRHFRESAKSLLSYGVRSYAVDLLGTFSAQIDQVLVVGLVSAAGLGIYSVALSISRLLGLFYTSLVVVLFPKAAGLEIREVVALTARAARISAMFTALGALALIVVLPFIMPFVYGGAFKAVIPVARILSCEIVFTATTSVLAQAFMASGRPVIVAALQILGLLLTIPLMLLLIPRLGLSGAALALLLSSASRLAMTAGCFPLVLKSSLPNLLVTRTDLVYLWGRFRHVRGGA